MAFTLNEHGFILNYLVSGCLEMDFASGEPDKNQLRYEKALRSAVSDNSTKLPETNIYIGKTSALGMPWEYYYSYGNWFVDFSSFCPLLKKVELYAATILVAAKEMTIDINLWSFAAIDIWLNEEHVGGISTPVYKPINKENLQLRLKDGENHIFIRLQDLGVRDTRTLFGISIGGEARQQLKVKLPGMEDDSNFRQAHCWLSEITMKNCRLNFKNSAPQNTILTYDTKTVDFTKFNQRYEHNDISGYDFVDLEPGKPYLDVTLQVNGHKMTRYFERQEEHCVKYSGVSGFDENLDRVFKRIAETGQIARGDGESFSMYPILARYYCNSVLPDDEKEIYKSLEQIERRRDCSDFLTCAMVRFMKLYHMGEKLEQRVKYVMLNYRYWMDENGLDGMCFWSENHSLMFFVSAYIAGDTWADDIFTRSGLTGKQMKERSRLRIKQWLSDVCEHGFDEFYSGGYTPITFAAILNVIDFGDDELSEMAVKAADRLLISIALQTFKGVSISPQGRVYREVLYPYMQDIQSIINIINPDAPDHFSEWIIFLATSKYRIGKNLKNLMSQHLSISYSESNALIFIEKTKNYMLTSVQSPRIDGIKRAWENISLDNTADDSYLYVKSLNESYHGTTQFEPGEYGYQQHMWYAALDNDTNIFVNHPGGSFDGSSMRPGYWYGNGIMPAIKQVKNLLYAIYQIPEFHPIPFTHLYWPKSRFDEQYGECGWLFGRKMQGFIGIWCSESLELHNDRLFDCEYRANNKNAAYLCVCSDSDEYSNMASFKEYCMRLQPIYFQENGVLLAAEDSLAYKEI